MREPFRSRELSEALVNLRELVDHERNYRDGSLLKGAEKFGIILDYVEALERRLARAREKARR